MCQDKTPAKVFFYHVDLMRFLFSVIIVIYHILHASIMPYVTDAKYTELAESLDFSTNIVVCFFIISGFFLYRSYSTNPEQGIFDYIVSRIVRLWPVLFFAILCEALLVGSYNWDRMLINSMFLQCSGISLEYKGILWYVSSFFFASVFLYAILRCFQRRKAVFLIALLTYFGCAFLVNYFDGRIGGRETVLYVLNIGVLRGVAFIGVGILLAVIYDKLQDMFRITPLSKWSRRILFVEKIVIEIISLIFLYKYFILSRSTKNHIVLVLVFALFLLCLVSERDPLGLLLNRKLFGLTGKYAYSIYVMQGTSFLILEKTLWQNASFVSNIWMAIGVSAAVSVVIGIGTYYIVERPCVKLYEKWKKKNRKK